KSHWTNLMLLGFKKLLEMRVYLIVCRSCRTLLSNIFGATELRHHHGSVSNHEEIKAQSVGDVGDANKERTVHEAWLKSSDKQYHTLLRLLKLSVIGFATIILDKKQTTAIILCCRS
ncbi:hypothetical protein R6Q59_017524, partial [Mikania micrantha]